MLPCPQQTGREPHGLVRKHGNLKAHHLTLVKAASTKGTILCYSLASTFYLLMSCPVLGGQKKDAGVHGKARDEAIAKFDALLPNCQAASSAVAACRFRVADEGQQPLNKVLWAVGVGRGHCQPEAEESRVCSVTREKFRAALMTSCGQLTYPFIHGGLQARYASCLQHNKRPEKCAGIFDKFLECAVSQGQA
jgi:hypothetical protein